MSVTLKLQSKINLEYFFNIENKCSVLSFVKSIIVGVLAENLTLKLYQNDILDCRILLDI